MFRLAIFICALITPLNAANEGSIILKSRNNGLFSVFFDVIAGIRGYESHRFTSFEVSFGQTGLYYEPDMGLNWWEYYFDPVVLGVKRKKYREVMGYFYKYIDPLALENLPKDEIHRVISKYIRVKPHIYQKVDHFMTENFQGFVIGVHYRGTDKFLEAPRVGYEQFIQVVLKKINELNNDYRIFIASDEQAFIDCMVDLFGDKVIYNKDAYHSTDNTSVHENQSFGNYKKGEDALIDCLLLSKTNFLIRTSSNLSLTSTYFNPLLEVFEINKRY